MRRGWTGGHLPRRPRRDPALRVKGRRHSEKVVRRRGRNKVEVYKNGRKREFYLR